MFDSLPVNPSSGLLTQMLAWIAARPRSYDATMEAWRTSCPRLSVWEDALAEGLVEVAGSGAQGTATVMLSSRGAARLERGA